MITKPNNTFFAQPKFLVGRRAMEHIPVELDGYNASRPLVITDSSISPQLTRRFIRSLADSNVTVGAVYDNCLPYVNADEINRISGLYQWRCCDSIIAIGGGAVMDNAKATRIAVAEEHEPSESNKKTTMVPLVYIATQVTDGYEVTGSMNIDGKRIYSESFYPDVVCIDKSMMLPQKNDKSLYFSALDALGHCIEGASMAQVNPFVDAAAFTAIRLIAENLRAMAKNPKDNSAMLGLINGIAVAGTVRSNTMKGMLCLSGSFLAQQTKNHAGLIIGVLLPYFIKDKINRGIPVRDDLLLALKGIDGFCAVPKNEKSDESLKVLLDILSSLNKRIPISLRELNIQQQLLDKAAAYVVESSESNIDRNDCRSFLQLAYENRIGGLQ